MCVLGLSFVATALAATVINVEESLNDRICKDDMFWMDSDRVGPWDEFSTACPAGYQPANLDSWELLKHAGSFTFSCIGPSYPVWITGAIGSILGRGDPMKLVAPDAIEKGGSVPFKRHRSQSKRRRHTRGRYSKSAQVTAQQPLMPGVNVRSVGTIVGDLADGNAHFLCQLEHPQ